MKVIWKFPLTIYERQEIFMPLGSEILTVQTQANNGYLWAIVDPNRGTKVRLIATYGTGQTIPDQQGHYIGTYQLSGYSGDAMIFHVFEI